MFFVVYICLCWMLGTSVILVLTLLMYIVEEISQKGNFITLKKHSYFAMLILFACLQGWFLTWCSDWTFALVAVLQILASAAISARVRGTFIHRCVTKPSSVASLAAALIRVQAIDAVAMFAVDALAVVLVDLTVDTTETYIYIEENKNCLSTE